MATDLSLLIPLDCSSNPWPHRGNGKEWIELAALPEEMEVLAVLVELVFQFFTVGIGREKGNSTPFKSKLSKQAKDLKFAIINLLPY